MNKSKQLFLLLLFSGLSLITSAQQVITGQILNAETNQAIAGASVFISNTSRGTATNSTGNFSLTDIPAGRHELVISSIGFETFVKTFSSADLPLRLEVKLKMKVKELESVTVAPFEKDGWAKWGRTFTENFIGTSGNATDCKIKNYKTIRFRFSKKENKLTAIAFEPLQINNKTLGYHLQYQLEGFELDFNQGSLVYQGYPLFEEMGNGKKKWQKAREKAYAGSMMHFVRSVFGNRLQEEGFDVKRLKKIINSEKLRVKALYKPISKTRKDEQTGKMMQVIEFNYERFPKDSVDYYEKVLGQKDAFDVYGDVLLTADSIAGIDESKTRFIFFSDYLAVTYKNGQEEKNYLLYINETQRPTYYQRSTVTLQGAGYVVIEPSGNYYNPMDLISTGYWAWKEKIANLLPYDYVAQP